MNMLIGSYHVFLFVEKLIEKRSNKQEKKVVLNVKELKKENKVA